MWTLGRAAVAGLVVGIAATAAVAATWGPTEPRPAPVHASPDAAAAYIADWRRSQLATWKVVLRWQRRVGGSQLEDNVSIAQRPPDRLSVAPGAVEARQGNRTLACAPGDDGRLRCRDAGVAPPYDQEVAAGERVLRDQLTGPGHLYDVVSPSPHCYDLRLRVSYPAPPFGQRARLCFDGATGAPTLREIDRTQGRDIQEAITTSGRVDAADLAPPPGLPG